MMKKLVGLFVLLLLAGGTAFGQESFEEWKRKQDEEFRQFVEKEDREFADFLKKEWEEFQAFRAMDYYEEPKPVYAPRVSTAPTRESLEKSNLIKEETVTVPERPAERLRSRPYEESTYVTDGFDRLKFDFMGLELSISDPGVPKAVVKAPLSNTVFSDAWLAFSEWDHETVVEECSAIREDYGLNDWGHYLLLHNVASRIFPEQPAAGDILTWYLMVKSGFDCRIGYNNRDVYLLIPSENRMYGVLYFYFNQAGPYYYFFTGGAPTQGVSQFYTYTGAGPITGKAVKMQLDKVPQLVRNKNSRDFFFMYRGKTYKLNVDIDVNLVYFGQSFPQTDMDVYFATPVSPDTRHSLVNGLKLLVADLPETEAANMILRFVQTAFDYQTDQQQFGIEKPMFVEETLFYPYCDCEDRSILYSYLIEEILGLSVIGLDYPGHIATAVAFSKPVSGDSVTFNGKRYVICDPTYINADIGMSMPAYKGERPGIIEIRRP